MSDDQRPEFGPSGYLPERASKRARKIVLRAPLGAQWIVASLVAGLVVLVAGVAFLLRSGDGPQRPWVEIAEVADLDATFVDDGLDVLIVTAGGRARAFADAADVDYCERSNRLESPDGRVWALTGRGFATPSLAEHPTVVHEGVLFVDPSRTSDGPPPSRDDAEPACP